MASKKITLKSSDGKDFEIDEAVAMESQVIRHMIEDDCADSAIPLPNINSKILSKVIAYCKKHAEAAAAASVIKLKAWDAEFVKVEPETLLDLIRVANYLDIESLRDLASQTVAVSDIMKGKTVEEIRKTFDIDNDFAPEEEGEIRWEEAWALE